MFGKPFAFYLARQRTPLLAITIMFFVRFALSVAGAPAVSGKVLSVTAVLLLALPYYALLAKREGLGFRHLYAFCFIQGLFSQVLVALAIAVGILTGTDNMYTIPEFYPFSNGSNPSFPIDGKNWMHAGAHIVFAGAIFIPLGTWIVSSVLLFIARRVKSW